MIETVSQVTEKEINYYMNLSYPILLVYDLEDDYWIARIPDLPGCTSHGADPNEAVRNVRDAQLCWVDVCIERGNEVPLPTPDSISVSLASERKEAAV